MDAHAVGKIIMGAGMSGAVPMENVMAAVAWVMAHAGPARTAGQQPPSSAAAAARNLSVAGAGQEKGMKRAPNVFQRAGKLKVLEWNRILKLCQDEWQGCCPTTTLPEGFPKRPKRRGAERERTVALDSG